MALPVDPRGREFVELVERLKYERWLAREVVAVLRSGFDEIASTLTTRYATLTAADRGRLRELASQVRSILSTAYQRVDQISHAELSGFSALSADVAAETVAVVRPASTAVASSFGLVTRGVVRSIADLPIEGLQLGEWWQAQARAMTDGTRRQIQAGLLLGEGPREIARRILPARGSETTPAAFRIARRNATMLVRTATTAVHNDAAVSTSRETGGRLVFRAVLDARTSAICRARDGEIYRADDPRLPTPPLHPNCVLGDCLVSPGGRIAAHMERRFEGELIVIRTAAGRELACTPNHPILTRRGWVPAQALHFGEEVVSHGVIDGPAPTRHDVQHVPARMHEIAEALRRAAKMPATEVPVSAPDFHGDGTDGEVAVVRADGLLYDMRNFALDEDPLERTLVCGELPGAVRLACSSALLQLGDRGDTATDGGMSGSSEPTPLLGRGSLHARLLLLMAIARGDAGLHEDAAYWEGAGAQQARDPGHTAALVEKANDRRRIEVGPPISARPHLHAAALEMAIERSAPDARAGRERSAVFASEVAFDQVVEIERRQFAGQVHNLETEFGVYAANGIITHNCRSYLAPAPDWKALGIAKPGGDVFRSYDGWLRGESPSTQDAILGRGKAELWRAGRLTLKNFVDEDGRELSLAELRRRLAPATALAAG
ncbi:MAG TPA: minor capsid protein [Candidatus Limnocylindria bacterium]|nr:minor capsid protein [Candidatus Limnocylindria bacterium]